MRGERWEMGGENLIHTSFVIPKMENGKWEMGGGNIILTPLVIPNLIGNPFLNVENINKKLR